MDRSLWTILGPVLLTLAGCTIEEGPGHFIKVDGRVTYQGKAVKKGRIDFLPVRDGGVAASGVINDGNITDVTTRTQGDGLRPGVYNVTIHAFEGGDSPPRSDAYNGPSPEEVAKLAANAKTLIPPRYTSVLDSGLKAEVSPTNHTFHFDLKD